MSEQRIKKDDVAKAIAVLEHAGKNISLPAITQLEAYIISSCTIAT